MTTFLVDSNVLIEDLDEVLPDEVCQRLPLPWRARGARAADGSGVDVPRATRTTFLAPETSSAASND